jgi:excisionase family DNA binding protein
MDILTVPQVAKELGITENTVRQYCQAGRLGQKIGRQWLITRHELETFKEQRRPPGRPPKEEG